MFKTKRNVEFLNEKSYTFFQFFLKKLAPVTSKASFQNAEPKAVPLITNQIESSKILVADLVEKGADAGSVFLRMILI